MRRVWQLLCGRRLDAQRERCLVATDMLSEERDDESTDYGVCHARFQAHRSGFVFDGAELFVRGVFFRNSGCFWYLHLLFAYN